MKKILHLLEAAIVYAFYTLFRILPLDAASWLGGNIARAFGPMLKAHTIAEQNLQMIFPEMEKAERQRILAGMWDNLGRVAAELPHLPGKALHERVTLTGEKNILAPENAAIFFSGHLANWELTYPAAFHRGMPITLVYRSANNPYVDRLIVKLRESQSTHNVRKGPKDAIKLVRAIIGGQSLAMLVDQKMNDGIAVPFFGREAMTAPAIAEFALRYSLPIIPVCVVRTGGCHFETTIFPQLQYEKTGDAENDVLAIMTQINQLLEAWIRTHPEQWFWVHKRWPSE